MKKSLIIAALLTVGLAACDKRDDTTPVEPPALDPVPPMTAPATPTPMDPPSTDPMAPPSESDVPPAGPTAPSQNN